METDNEISCAQVIPLKKRLDTSLDIFLGLRAAGNFKNQWGCPGGKVDADETLEQAAVRELEEETGGITKVDQLEFLRRTVSESAGRVYAINTYLLDASELDLRNTRAEEHGFMAWRRVRDLLAHHEDQEKQGQKARTISPVLFENIKPLRDLEDKPLNEIKELLLKSYDAV